MKRWGVLVVLTVVSGAASAVVLRDVTQTALDGAETAAMGIGAGVIAVTAGLVVVGLVVQMVRKLGS